MNFFNKLQLALIGAVAISAIAQPTAVFAISVQVPSASVVAATKAEDFLIQGEEKDEKGDYQGAIAAYTQAILLSPNYAEAYNGRGNARYRLGDYKAAVADFNEALRINPNYAKAYNSRGNVRAELGDKQGAIQDFQKAADLFQNQGDKNNYQKALNNLRRLQ